MYTCRLAGKAFPPPFSRSLDPRPFSTCFDFCPGESDNIWDPISIQLLSPSPIPYHNPHLLSLQRERRSGILLRRNEKHNGPNVGIVRRAAQRRYFSAFFSQIGGRVNCRWRRRQCGSGGTSFTMGIAAFSDKSAKRGAAFVAKSFSLSLGSPVRIFPHCRGQRQTRKRVAD